MGVYEPSNFEIWCEHPTEPLRETQRNHPARRLRAVRQGKFTRRRDRARTAPRVVGEET